MNDLQDEFDIDAWNRYQEEQYSENMRLSAEGYCKMERINQEREKSFRKTQDTLVYGVFGLIVLLISGAGSLVASSHMPPSVQEKIASFIGAGNLTGDVGATFLAGMILLVILIIYLMSF